MTGYILENLEIFSKIPTIIEAERKLLPPKLIKGKVIPVIGKSPVATAIFAPILARAAVAAGATGIFAETHPRPEDALSDGPNMIKLGELETALRGILEIRALNKSQLAV